MNFETPTPAPEKEPRFLTLEEIKAKMNSLIDTRAGKCKETPRIEKRPDGLTTLVEYEVRNDGGSTAVFAYRLKGPRSHNTTIDLAHFRGNPDDGDWLGAGGTLSNYDEGTGKWTDVEGVE